MSRDGAGFFVYAQLKMSNFWRCSRGDRETTGRGQFVARIKGWNMTTITLFLAKDLLSPLCQLVHRIGIYRGFQ